MRGTQTRTFQQIFNDLETAGASRVLARACTPSVSVVMGWPRTCRYWWIRWLLPDQPVFPAEHVERMRAQYLTGLAIRAQDTAEMSSLAFDEILFANHPYSLPEDGYPETIQRITRADLVEFHRGYYSPKGLVLVVVGAVSPEAVVEAGQPKIGPWRRWPPAEKLPEFHLPPRLRPMYAATFSCRIKAR